MIQALAAIIAPERIRSRYIDLVSYASDAGFYYLVPKAVVQPVSESEIIALFAFSQQHQVPLVFRTGGTSLSGQSVTDGILVDLSKYWNKISVLSDGEMVRVQPGITGGMVNARLSKFSRKIGPDPSSISAAMMGGILSNNASGMCCGVALNSYHTTRYIRFILPDGKLFSTENSEDYHRFETECNSLFKELNTIRNEINSDDILHAKIRNKYLTKTTIGYSLNAFVDYKHPLDILAHLLIGAEGTLAFISEALLNTVPDHPFKSTALLYFPNIYDACQAIVPLTESGAQMVELMDRASLRAVEDLAGMPAFVKTLPYEAAALLIEFQESEWRLLEKRVNAFLAASASLSLLNAPVFTSDAAEQAFLWKVRKGLFPAVGAVRASGTTVVLEDIAFPVAKLGDAITDLQVLFKKYHYDNAIIFGHAKDGNIHFVITQSFNTDAEIKRYDAFMQEVVLLVVQKYQGTLKAEHGTGRNMAPFVEAEWGGEAYAIMKRIKQLVDPHNLLNPGVIINSNPLAHLKNLKALPSVEVEVDRCIECGYCEPVCPSRDLTTTPRRRIVVRRVLKNLQMNGEQENYNLLLKQYNYEGIETCAVDGLCAGACPVDINTGDLVKRLRRENHSASANKTALFVARHFKQTEWLIRAALKSGLLVNRVFGQNAMRNLTLGIRKISDAFPLWSNQLQSPPSLKSLDAFKEASSVSSIVYFPSCISRTLGSYKGRDKNIMEVFASICKKAGIGFTVPENIAGSCCSQIFGSKGFGSAYAFTANAIVETLWKASNEGKKPVVTDVSSCAYTLHHLRPVLNNENMVRFDRLTILDSVDFLHDMLLPFITPGHREEHIVLHPVCSLQKLKTSGKFIAVAKHFAQRVTVPENTGCCGMAGDRGFLFPELTASATLHEANEVQQQTYSGYYSTTRTCEMAMSDAVKQQYETILYLVDNCM